MASAPIQGRHQEVARIPPVFELRGACAPTEQVTYTIDLVPGRQHELEAKMAELAESSGPWLTKEQVESYTRPKPEHVDALRSYFAQHGMGEDRVQPSPSQEKWTIQSTAAEVNQMWGTDLAHFHNTQTGADVIRSTHGYTIPHALSDAVLNLAPFASFATMSHGPVHVQPASRSHVQVCHHKAP